MNFNTQYQRVRPAPLIDNAESITQQHFGPQCNINSIIARYNKSGILSTGIQGTRRPMFGDFSNIQSFHEAQNQILEAQNAFMSLPAAVRKKFDNNPGKLLAFLENPENKAEAVELGLIDAPAPIPAPAPAPISTENVSK